MFFTATLCNYADDSTMYSSNKNANIVISRLRYDFEIIYKCFYEKCMVRNANKSHFQFFSTSNENVTKENILEIVIDNKLNFKSHLKKYAKKLTKNPVHPQECQNKQHLISSKKKR